MQRAVSPEARVTFAGVEFVHPRVRRVEPGEALPRAMTPIYPATACLPQSALRTLIDRALERENLDDALPEPLRARHRLAPFADSLRTLQHPPHSPGCDPYNDWLVHVGSLTARGAWRLLAGLGTKPLGELLFTDPLISREALRYARLDARYPLHVRAASVCGAQAELLWGRRSLFRRDGRAILVSEVFLPAILQLPS